MGVPSAGRVDVDKILVHVVAETHRHTGHADVVRELIDGAAGLRAEVLCNLARAGKAPAGGWPTASGWK